MATGRQAETVATAFLALAGYEIVERNVRIGPDELDVIAKRGDWLVVAEVRYRDSADAWSPEESLDPRKQLRLRRAGRAYWERWHHPTRPPQSSDSAAPEYPVLRLRFDLVAITRRPDGLQVKHYQHVLAPHGPLRSGFGLS